MNASAEELTQVIRDALAGQQKLSISGHGSKRQWLPTPPADAQMLCLAEYSGVLDYQPQELVVTALAGTPVKELEKILLQNHQQLAFEPPQYFASGTVGGMVSSGLSGPARPWGGAVRDAVLGVDMINGLGEQLSFGGRVMKNVAGYDVSRLMAGAFGALGVLHSVSLRVQPLAEFEQTLRINIEVDAGIGLCRDLATSYSPLHGSWWCEGELWLRLAGSTRAVQSWTSKLMTEQSAEALSQNQLWRDVRDQSADFFKTMPLNTSAGAAAPGGIGNDRGDCFLCRVIVPPATGHELFGDISDVAIEWAGGQRWMWHPHPPQLRQQVAELGGWVWVLGESDGLSAAIPPVQRKLMLQIKKAFDPNNIFVSPVLAEPDAEQVADQVADAY